MQKSFALAALSATSAKNIDLFSAKNFMNIPTEEGIRALIKSGHQAMFSASNGLGDVSYEQCDDDVGSFTFDGDNTYNDPAPVVKDSDLTLNLAGIFGDSGTLKNIHIHVDWNGTPLYDEDHEQTTDIGDEFTTAITWNVPAIAPAGDYEISLVGTGDLAGSTDAKIMCIHASMTL